MVKKVVRTKSSSKATTQKAPGTTKPKIAKKQHGSDRATTAYNKLRRTLRE